MRLRFAFAAFLLGGLPARGQTSVDLSRQAKLPSGSQLPGACAPGQLYLLNGGAGGPVLYVCTQTNVWTAPTPYTAGTGIAITGGTLASDDAVAPVYYTGTGVPAIDCAAGRDYYVDLAARALYYCAAASQWQAVSAAGHAHTAADIVSGTLDPAVLPGASVLSTRANTYAAGQRQSVAHDAANAGLRLAPAAGDPAGAQDGDLWYNLTTGRFRRKQNGIVGDWDASGGTHSLLSASHSDTTPATVTRGDLITGQGATAAWKRLALGAAGSYLRSNGADLTYAPISPGDLPAGYSWTSLANVPASFPPSGHAATHQHGGGDEIATASPAANAIPKAGDGGSLAAGWLPAPGPASLGGVQSKDCSGTGHVQKINPDGTVTCSADAAGGGGGATAGYGIAVSGSGGLTWNLVDPAIAGFREDFLYSTSATTFGAFGHQVQADTGSPAAKVDANTSTNLAQHPGVVRITFPTTANPLFRLRPLEYNVLWYNAPDVLDWDQECIINVTDANTRTWCGMNTDSPFRSSASAGIRYDPANSDTQFTAYLCNSGTCANAAFPGAFATGWHTLHTWHRASGVGGNPTYYAQADALTPITFCSSGCTAPATNAPTAMNLTPQIGMGYNGTPAAGVIFEIDYHAFAAVGLTRN